LSFQGEVGDEYRIEAASDPAIPGNWELLLGLNLTNELHDWFDNASPRLDKRFYRAVRLPNPLPPVAAEDFRLSDHEGRSHSLFYHTDARAVVLIFTGANANSVDGRVQTLNSLRNRFTSRGVLFWLLASSSPTNRAALAAAAATLGITLPILEDEGNLVAGAYQAESVTEAVAIDANTWEIFYRGAIDDRPTGERLPTTQDYLEKALENFLANQTVSPHRTRAEGVLLEFPVPRPISYAQEVAPILENRCVRCHSLGNIAPWAITNYASIQAQTASIKTEILANRMPPWHADPAHGTFANDFSLRPAEKATLIAWIDQGAPKGEGGDPLTQVHPPPPDWPLGTPTTVLSIPKQNIPATGVVDYRYINVTTSFATDVWLQAAVVRPGNRKVVHHCLVYFGSTSLFMGIDGFFAGYVPGYDPVMYPPGTGKFIPKGTVLRFQMHYTTTGQPETDQTQLGLYVMQNKPAYELQTRSTFDILFSLGLTSIPPRHPDYEMTAEYEFSSDVLLYEMSPHMHLRGSRFKYEVIYPDATRETVLSVPHYSFDWQTLYRFAEPKRLPAGSRLFLTAAWDNSPQNPHNPDPSKAVRFGEQTFNEMFIGYFNFAELPKP